MTRPDGRPEPQQLTLRAGMLLKLLVERYVADGQPVGSRTLSEQRGVGLSAATIRNVLADLEQLGFIRAPHTSAGRVPTDAGIRYFVDSLLEVEPLDLRQQRALRQQLLRGLRHGDEVADSLSGTLSRLSRMAAVVTVPRQGSGILRRIDFVRLTERRVLAVMVVDSGKVQNRVFELEQPLSEAQLSEAAARLNAEYAGHSLDQIRQALSRQVHRRQRELNELMKRAADMVERAARPAADDCVISGGSNLFAFDDLLGVERLRGLFEAFDRKRDLLHLIESCQAGEGVQIFIGEQSGYELLGGCSLVTAPYVIDGESAGVIGVIGPTRMAYERIIPLVDAAAQLAGDALNSGR